MKSEPEKKSKGIKSLRRLFDLFASDMSLNEIERLIKRDVPGVYDFYVREMEIPDQSRNRLMRALTFARNFFTAFLRKLTPARRLVYALVLFLFFYGSYTSRWGWAFLSFLILNVLLALEVTDKLTAKDELEVARDIQMSLMPEKAPSSLAHDIACFSEAAREVGGDYYDFIRPKSGDNRTYIVIGDVSGKGTAAALYMVRLQALLHYLTEMYTSPQKILIALNQNIKNILRHNYFISLNLVSVNSNREFVYCRAGHLPLLHYQSSTQRFNSLQSKGIAVGLENNGRFEEEIEEITLHPQPGDILVFYTDGVVETMNGSREEYGENRLKLVIKSNAGRSSPEIKNALLADLARFRGSTPPHDDLTFIIMKIV